MDLKLVNNILKIEKTEDEVVNDMIQFIDSLINSCNSFVRPEFSKLHIMSPMEFRRKEEEEEAMDKMTLQQDEKEMLKFKIFGGHKGKIIYKFM